MVRVINILTLILVLVLLAGAAYFMTVRERQMAAERSELEQQLASMRKTIAQNNAPRDGSPAPRTVEPKPPADATPEVAHPPEAQIPVPQYQKPEPPPARKDERADDIDPNAKQIADERQKTREDERASREARVAQTEAAKTYYDALSRKETAQRAMIAWKNKLNGAIKDRDRAILDQSAAQGEVTTSRVGPTLVTIDTRGNIQDATQRRTQADKEISEAQTALAKAEHDFAEASRAYESAQMTKQNADRTARLKIPEKPAPKFTATYTLKDGRTLTAVAVIATEDEYWIKSQDGIEAVRKDDVTEILK
jgi:hypothetical protein